MASPRGQSEDENPREGAGRRGQREAEAAPEVQPLPTETQEQLDAIVTAAGVIDGQTEQMLRLHRAGDTLYTLAPQVRALVATIRPLMEQKATLETFLADNAGKAEIMQAQIDQAQALAVLKAEELAGLEKHIAEARKLLDELTALRQA